MALARYAHQPIDAVMEWPQADTIAWAETLAEMLAEEKQSLPDPES